MNFLFCGKWDLITGFGFMPLPIIIVFMLRGRRLNNGWIVKIILTEPICWAGNTPTAKYPSISSGIMLTKYSNPKINSMMKGKKQDLLKQLRIIGYSTLLIGILTGCGKQEDQSTVKNHIDPPFPELNPEYQSFSINGKNKDTLKLSSGT